MKSLITGANGFIGRHLIDHLSKNSSTDEIIALTRNPFEQNGVKVYFCDLNDDSEVFRILNEVQPDRIYHLAGISRVAPRYKFADYFSDNFLTTMSLLKSIQKIHKPVTFFFASSMHIYGNQSGVVTEKSEEKPVSDYGYSKFLAEQALKHFANHEDHIRVIVGRLYNCLGPNQPEGFVVSDLCRRIRELPEGKEAKLETGPLNGLRRFLDVRDLAILLPQLMAFPFPTRFEVFNIASPYEMTIQNILDSLLKISGKTPTVETHEEASPNPFIGFRLDTTKLETLLHPTFRPIEATLKDCWEGAK